MKLFFTGLGLWAGMVWGFAQPVFNRAKADSLFDGLDRHHKAMGSVTVRENGVVVYDRSIGFRSAENGDTLPNDAQTRFRVGSVSKMFTSVMVFRQIEAGKLTLETKLSEFYPELPQAADIEISNLLTHSSGLHSFTDEKSYGKWATAPQTREQMLKRIKKLKPDFKPGSRYAYSNVNFVLLGYILEKVTGQPYAELLRTEIAEPAGLKNTYYGGKINPAAHEAFSYSFDGTRWVKSTETDMSIPHGAGAVVSTPEDLALFMTALFSERLLSKTSLDQMTKITLNYGHGIFKMPFHAKTAYGHTGAIDGFRAQAVYFPDEKVAVGFCADGFGYSINEIMTGVLSSCFDMPYTCPDFRVVTLTDAQLVLWEGVFSSPGFPLKITLKKQDGKLTAQATGQRAFALETVGEKEFRFIEAGIKIKSASAPGEKVKEFEFTQGGQKRRFTREK